MKIHEYNQMMKYLTRPAEPKYEQVAMVGKIKKGADLIKKLVKKGEAPKTDVDKVKAKVEADKKNIQELADEGQIPVKSDIPEPFAGKFEEEFMAHDNMFGRRSGDNKVDAQEIAEQVAEARGQDYYDLGYKEQMDLYDKAYNYLTLLDRTKDAMKEATGRTLNSDGGFQSKEFLEANRAKAAKASAAAKKKAMEKSVDKPTSTNYEGVKGVKFKDASQKKEYVDFLKKRYSFPKQSRDELNMGNKVLAKKFGISEYEVERINSVLKKELNLKYPKQTYEGTEKRLRERDVRRKQDIKKTSDPKVEKKIKDVIREVDPNALKNDIDLAHRASLKANSMFGANYLSSSLGVDPKIVNQELVRSAEQKLGKLYNDQKTLIKGLKPGKFPKDVQKKIEQLNFTINRISGETNGALQGVLMDEKTGKVRTVVGKDYAKVLGMGLVDKDIKDLTQADIDLIKLNLPEQIKKAKQFKGTKLYSGFSPELGKLSYEVLKDVAKGIPTPLGAIGLNVGLGVDPKETIDRVGIEAELALAPELVKQSARFGPAAQRILNLGLKAAPAMRVARALSPLGLLSLAGEAGYYTYKKAQETQAAINAMTPHQRELYESQMAGEALMGEAEFADGGRVGFKKGGMDRRTFIKLMGGLASLPIVGKFIKPAAKTAAKVSEVPQYLKDEGMPDFFYKVVEAVKRFGKKEKYKTGILNEDDVYTYYNPKRREHITVEDGPEEVRINFSSDTGNPSTIGVKKGIPDESTKGKTPPDEYFEVSQIRFPDQGGGGYKDIVEEVVGGYDDLPKIVEDLIDID